MALKLLLMTTTYAASTMSEPRTMEQRVTDILRRIGITARHKGYYYVRDAILLIVENENFIGFAEKELYPVIAKSHNTTSARIGKAIYNCLAAACIRGNKPFIDHLFGSGAAERGIANKEFIATIADLLKTGYLDVLIGEDNPTTNIDEP